MVIEGLIGIISSAAVFTSNPARATVLAQCGASTGQAYYEDSNPGWQADRISTGRFVFTVDESGKPDVLFKDVTGKVVNSAADGGIVTFTRRTPNEFGISVFYPEDGTAESFNVVKKGRGSGRRLLWTSSKAGGPVTKVGAYIADCN